MKKYLLFDLDGTITDSAEGIVHSVAYALERMGIQEEDKSRLTRFVGPPLRDSFMEYYGFTEEQAEQAVWLYREYYEEKGIFENKVYEGIEHLLDACCRAGRQIILATAKPQNYAEQILDYFKLRQYFADVQGSSMDKSKVTKTDVIRCALADNRIEHLDEAVMIGDRKHDVEGARTCGLKCAGVLFGYGGREELEQCKAEWILDTVEDLEAFLLESDSR